MYIVHAVCMYDDNVYVCMYVLYFNVEFNTITLVFILCSMADGRIIKGETRNHITNANTLSSV